MSHCRDIIFFHLSYLYISWLTAQRLLAILFARSAAWRLNSVALDRARFREARAAEHHW